MASARKNTIETLSDRVIAEMIQLMEERASIDIPFSDVAKSVGCSLTQIQDCFHTRDALLQAVHDEGFRRLYASAHAISSNSEYSPLEVLRQAGYAYILFALGNPMLYQLMFAPPASAGLHDNPFKSDIGRQTLDLVSKRVRTCQQAGYFPHIDAGSLAFTFWSAVHGALSLILLDRAPTECNRQLAGFRVIDTLVDIVVGTRDHAPG